MAEQMSSPGPDFHESSLPQRPPTTQEAVLQTLRQAIATGALRPGERLYQDAIAEKMGVSRVPVREALNVLRADGQLEYSPHKGYWISTLSRDGVEEINLIRGLLEGEALRRAIQRTDDQFVEHLEAVNTEMATANDDGDLPGFISLNHDFHFAMFDRAGLPRLRKHIEALWKSADAYRTAVFNNDEARKRMLSEHEELIEAFRDRDAPEAIRIMRDHRGKAVDMLSTLLASQENAS